MTYTCAAVLALLVSGCGEVSSKVDAMSPSQDGKSIDAPSACTVGVAAFCMSDQLVTCDGQGNITGMSTCDLGCNAAASRCNKVDPSNGFAMALDEAATAPDLAFVGAATINTDTGTITDTSGTRVLPTMNIPATPVQVFLIKVKSLTTDGAVTVTGTRALAIVSAGDVSIGHVVSVSASFNVPGPGAANCSGGNAAAGNAEGKAGGGGGGFGTPGGAGGIGGVPSVTAGIAGAAVGSADLKPLRGGCSGGRASNVSTGHAPGAGGGAMQIVSGTAIRLTAGGMLTANGGGGIKTSALNFACLVDTPCGNGEGGGSGGAILLEAPIVAIPASTGIFANGGGGTCNLNSASSNGSNTTSPAQGTACTGQVGSGGDGAAGAIAATVGVGRTGNDSVGGGGGGGLGRIRINLPAGVTLTPGGTTSGALSVGALGVR